MNTEPDVKTTGGKLIIEVPRDGLDDWYIENLRKLILGKANLIMKALNVPEVPMVVTDKSVGFPWFNAEASSEEIQAYTQLICALVKMAKERRRIYSVSSTVENERYAFRCFLLRLGFIGNQYKAARRILLKNLSGNAAYVRFEDKNRGGHNL